MPCSRRNSKPVDFFKMDELEKKVAVGFKTFAFCVLLAPKKKSVKVTRCFVCLFLYLKNFHPTKKNRGEKNKTGWWFQPL